MMKCCGRNSKPTELVRVIKEEREKEQQEGDGSGGSAGRARSEEE